MSPPRPGHRRSSRRCPARDSDRAGQALLHIRPQRRVCRELRRLRTFRCPLGVPLRDGRPVLEPAAPRGGVTAQLARDSRRRSPKPL